MIDRMISTQILPEDMKIENHLRPTLLKDYIGQELLGLKRCYVFISGRGRILLWQMV